jgi:transposase-like protein
VRKREPAAGFCWGDKREVSAGDLDALVVHLRYPLRHRRRWRSTNLLERSLGEVKRRTKVMG